MLLKSDHAGIEIDFTDKIRDMSYYKLKSDHAGIEIPSLSLIGSTAIEVKIRPCWD